MDFNEFLKIRKTYAELLPGWLAEYAATGEMRQHAYFHDWEFSPIERHVWSDIRDLGLPFYPQLPVLNFFIDFGCPFLKIGIECDGKAWHDSELDAKRDKKLAAEGWTIFRIEGHECIRTIDPWPEWAEEECPDLARLFYFTTSEGVLSAIKQKYFGEPIERHSYLIDCTLFEHMSTPDSVPPIRPTPESAGPVLVGALIDEYVRRLKERVTSSAA